MSKPFPGFPYRMQFTPLPNLFFSTLLPEMDNLVELKVVLHLFWLLYQKRGYPKFVTYRELLADKALMLGMANDVPPAEALRTALELASQQGILLHLAVKQGDKQDDVYFLNTESNKKVIARLQEGELSLGGALPQGEPYVKAEKPDIFALYEQNIGMLTPMIAEELAEAEKLYPADWVQQAFKEAVSLNKRNWRYIIRILERWSAEGKDAGEPGRDSEKKKASPDRYFKGKYGHLVRR